MNNMAPFISVVITTYNRQDKFKRALASVLGQTFKDFEVIIVDNASSDGTREYIQSQNDQRIRYIRHESNLGGCAARNTGIKNSKAMYIALLDDDDEWFASRLEKQLKVFEHAPPGLGLVYVGTEIYDEQKQCILKNNVPQYKGRVYERLLLGTILGSVSSVLVKRECFEKAGLFDETLSSCQDWDMWLRLARYFEFDYVDEILVRINVHGEQISTDYSRLIPGRTRMVQKHAEEFSKYPDIYLIHLKR